VFAQAADPGRVNGLSIAGFIRTIACIEAVLTARLPREATSEALFTGDCAALA
jgi:hypothetical protein